MNNLLQTNKGDKIRVKISKKNQRELFQKFKRKLGTRKRCTRYLGVKEGTYKEYSSTKVRYLPEKILKKVCLIIKEKIPHVLERKTLKEIRQNTIKKTYPVLEKKYGNNWLNVIARKGHESLKKKYGEEWMKILAKKGYNTSRKLYGKNFQKKIWKRALLSLEKKYGKDWSKINNKKAINLFKKKYGRDWANILMTNARNGLLKKYGDDWARILSRKGGAKLRKKYGKNYHQELYKLANFLGKHHLTDQEKEICRELKKNNISFETNCVRNEREYDIVIPNLKNPKIVIECSDINPTLNNQRYKMLQLIEQQKNFPNSLHLAILKRKGKNI